MIVDVDFNLDPEELRNLDNLIDSKMEKHEAMLEQHRSVHASHVEWLREHGSESRSASADRGDQASVGRPSPSRRPPWDSSTSPERRIGSPQQYFPKDRTYVATSYHGGSSEPRRGKGAAQRSEKPSDVEPSSQQPLKNMYSFKSSMAKLGNPAKPYVFDKRLMAAYLSRVDERERLRKQREEAALKEVTGAPVISDESRKYAESARNNAKTPQRARSNEKAASKSGEGASDVQWDRARDREAREAAQVKLASKKQKSRLWGHSPRKTPNRAKRCDDSDLMWNSPTTDGRPTRETRNERNYKELVAENDKDLTWTPFITARAAALQRDELEAEQSPHERLYSQHLDLERRKLDRQRSPMAALASHKPALSERASNLRRLPGTRVEDDLMRQGEIWQQKREERRIEEERLNRPTHQPKINAVSDAIAQQLPETAKERLFRDPRQLLLKSHIPKRSFSPVISAKSREIDESRRYLADAYDRSETDPAMQRIRDMERKEYRKQEQLMHQRLQQQEEELAHCTFHPSLNASTFGHPENEHNEFANTYNGSDSSVADRSQMWIERRDAKLAAQREDTQKKALDDCTFAPKITRAAASMPHGHVKSSMQANGSYPSAAHRHSEQQQQPADTVYGGDGHAWGFHQFVQRQQEARTRKEEDQRRLTRTAAQWKNEPTEPQEPLLGRQRFEAVGEGRSSSQTSSRGDRPSRGSDLLPPEVRRSLAPPVSAETGKRWANAAADRNGFESRRREGVGSDRRSAQRTNSSRKPGSGMNVTPSSSRSGSGGPPADVLLSNTTDVLDRAREVLKRAEATSLH